MRFVFHLTDANFIGLDVLPFRTDLLYQIIFGVRFFQLMDIDDFMCPTIERLEVMFYSNLTSVSDH
jgi:hypothetical protein